MKRKRQKRESSANQEPVVIASPDTDVENFGPWLQQQREVREIDRREVADASKISVRYIEALETNRFEVLPAEVFTKGFLRQYAVYVGLDPEEVVNYYLAALHAQRGEQEADSDQSPRPRSSRGANAKWVLAAMLVGGALMSLVWLLFRMSATGLPTIGDAAAGAPEANEASGVSSGGVAAEKPSTEEALAAVDQPLIAAEVSEGGSPTGDTTDVDESVAEPRLGETQQPETSSPSPLDAVGEAPLTVVVDFSGDCWVEATLDDGRKLAEMRVQGESLRLEADTSIDLKLGNARVVEILVNGMPYAVEPARGSSVVDIRVDLQTVANLRGTRAGDAGSRLE